MMSIMITVAAKKDLLDVWIGQLVGVYHCSCTPQSNVHPTQPKCLPTLGVIVRKHSLGTEARDVIILNCIITDLPFY